MATHPQAEQQQQQQATKQQPQSLDSEYLDTLSGPNWRSAPHPCWDDLTTREKEEDLRRRATPTEIGLKALLLADSRTQAKFKFQAHVLSYFVDFLFTKSKLVVEVDGSVHSTRSAKIADAARTRALSRSGYTVIRFWNGEVRRDPARVIALIVSKLRELETGQSAVSAAEVRALPIDPETMILSTRQRGSKPSSGQARTTVAAAARKATRTWQ